MPWDHLAQTTDHLGCWVGYERNRLLTATSSRPPNCGSIMDACKSMAKHGTSWLSSTHQSSSPIVFSCLFTLHKATKCVRWSFHILHPVMLGNLKLETFAIKKMAILHIMENLPAVLDFFSSCNMIAVACCSRLLLLLKKKMKKKPESERNQSSASKKWSQVWGFCRQTKKRAESHLMQEKQVNLGDVCFVSHSPFKKATKKNVCYF